MARGPETWGLQVLSHDLVVVVVHDQPVAEWFVQRHEMLAELARVADDVIGSETIQFPIPMGLPRPGLPPA